MEASPIRHEARCRCTPATSTRAQLPASRSNNTTNQLTNSGPLPSSCPQTLVATRHKKMSLTSSVTHRTATKHSPSAIQAKLRTTAAVLTGTRTSRWRRRTDTSLQKCGTWRTAQGTRQTTTTTLMGATTARWTRMPPKLGKPSRWALPAPANTTSRPRVLKTSARQPWPLACAQGHKGTQARKTQISSEVNYIALYFVYHLGIRYN